MRGDRRDDRSNRPDPTYRAPETTLRRDARGRRAAVFVVGLDAPVIVRQLASINRTRQTQKKYLRFSEAADALARAIFCAATPPDPSLRVKNGSGKGDAETGI